MSNFHVNICRIRSYRISCRINDDNRPSQVERSKARKRYHKTELEANRKFVNLYGYNSHHPSLLETTTKFQHLETFFTPRWTTLSLRINFFVHSSPPRIRKEIYLSSLGATSGLFQRRVFRNCFLYSPASLLCAARLAAASLASFVCRFSLSLQFMLDFIISFSSSEPQLTSTRSCLFSSAFKRKKTFLLSKRR